ncbi:4'-phosphopantetheinyl transferase family protein [Streptomyces sp. NPDC088757]|uniref:4'-phosphopantetheinyl transferase family protein n=1 Tax=Streptomyces sp. NPDC088757 TaxID=3365889 RepID=UPI00380FF630
MAPGLIPAGFTDQPVLLPLAHDDVRTVTLLGRVDETSLQTAASGNDDPQAPHTLSAARRREFLAGRALLRLAVAELTGTPAEKVQIGTRGGKRPFCLNAREVDVSISHSAGRIAVTAAHGCEVGIDIQLPVPVSARLLLRYDVAGSEPVTRAAPGPRRDDHSPDAPVTDLGDSNRKTQATDLHYEFANAWTVREACAKSLGLRVGADLWRIRVPPKARRGNWGDAHWYRMPPFQGCPVALALHLRSRNAVPRSRESNVHARRGLATPLVHQRRGTDEARINPM